MRQKTRYNPLFQNDYRLEIVIFDIFNSLLGAIPGKAPAAFAGILVRKEEFSPKQV